MQRINRLKTLYPFLFMLIIVLGLAISPISQGLSLPDSNALLSEPSGITNWQVHSACSDAIKGRNPEAKSMGQFVCRMTQDMVYEQNLYHQNFVKYFTEKNMEEPLYIIEGYSVTGCDISELDRANFTAMIVHYFDHFEDELEDSFF